MIGDWWKPDGFPGDRRIKSSVFETDLRDEFGRRIYICRLLKTLPSSYITKVEKNAPYRLHEAIGTLIRIYKISETAPAESTGRKHLNPPDMQTLLFVGERTTCIANDVAEHLRVAPTTASSIIDRLVRRGLLLRERTEENRRVVQLRLTKEGQKLQTQVLKYQLANCRAMLGALKASEQEVFVRLISTIADTVSRAGAR